jgi:hypothetical protein
MWDIVDAERKESELRLLKVVEEHLPFLQSVSFGGSRYNLTRTDATGLGEVERNL